MELQVFLTPSSCCQTAEGREPYKLGLLQALAVMSIKNSVLKNCKTFVDITAGFDTNHVMQL